jgi:hypothetical protein
MKPETYKNIERYIVWFALFVIAAHSLLGDHLLKVFVNEHFRHEEIDMRQLKELRVDVDMIRQRHADQDLQRFKLGINPKEVCK